MQTKDTAFYNDISSTYSLNRYPAQANSYGQFFFKERLALLLQLLAKYASSPTPKALLEVGCADGVVIRAIHETFPTAFSPLHANDISPDMIVAAQRLHAGAPITFAVRGAEDARHYDVVIEIGVINYADVREEILRASAVLQNGGVAMVSYAATNSLWNNMKPGSKGFTNFLSYPAFEALLAEHFSIVQSVPVGLFIPLVWKLPALARVLHRILEPLLRPLVPNAFHEKLYVLTKKDVTA